MAGENTAARPTPARGVFAGLRARCSLILLLTLLGAAGPAFAGEFCVQDPSPFGIDEDGDGINDYGLVDGSDPATVQFIEDNNVTQITVDGDCTFANWTAANPLTVTINFQTNDPSIYLITFDNTIFTGNMACANIEHRIWFVNGNPDDFRVRCQDLFIPVEAINKLVPAGQTTVGIGEIFSYTLMVPVLYDPVTGTYIDDAGSANDLHSITVIEDLNAIGADLTLVGTPTVEWAPGSSSSGSVAHTYTNVGGVLTFEIAPPGTLQIPAGDQFAITITLSVDDTNAIGTQFFNTATWTFGRLIDIDGVPTFFDPLPGENGVSDVLTIGAPDLTVNKSSPETAINLGVPATFSIDVQNTGNTPAYDFTIEDIIPDAADNPAAGEDAGMCAFDPSATVSARIFEADGTTAAGPVLVAGTDYTIEYDDPPDFCTLILSFDSSAVNAPIIEPGQRLIISYQSQLDGTNPLDPTPTTQDGALLTNVAGATEWFSSDPDLAPTPLAITRTLSDGTPGTSDHEDSYTVTTGLTGYFFTKSVQNITSGANPASTAVSGDTLQYQLRVFNLDQTIDDIIITDPFLTSTFFDTSSFAVISSNANSVTYDTGTEILTIDGGSVTALNELVVEFQIDLATGLANGTDVGNQATMTATGTITSPAVSDDPNDGVVETPPAGNPTIITIQQPDVLAKTGGPASATIGDEITYRVTVPATTVPTPLYDVRILDDLTASGADLEFVSASVVSGGSWTLTNTGTSSNLVIEDTGAGIDIPASGQAEIDITVRVANTLTNQIGVSFDNTASYTYNRTNNLASSQTATGDVTTASSTVITEPGIVTFTKVADNLTPTPGDIVTYTITLTADSGANVTDVFDVTLEDTLDLGLAYFGNTTVTTGGAGGSGAGDGNSITDPDITGDGITTQQFLTWTTVEADIDIDAGETIVIEYQVEVLGNALQGQVLENEIFAQWTGIDGINLNERNGIDGIGGLNDYATATATATLTTPVAATTIDKVRSDDTFGSGDNELRVGDIVEYTLTIPIPEVTLGNLQIVDTLPEGLDFIGVVDINGNAGPAPYTAVAPFVHADIAAPVEAGDPTTGSSTVTWDLGDVTSPADDGIADNFVIVYQAQVLNGDVLAQADSTVLTNSVTMTYDTATGTVTDTDNDTTIDVLQPNVTVSKSASAAGGDQFVDPGEVITYTVDIVNTGTAPVYDPVLEDVIPDGLRVGGVTTTSIETFPTVAGTPVASLATFAPTYSAATGLATWDFDNGVTPDTYTIAVGETLRIEYEVTADAGIAGGLILTNAATATLYYSFDDDDPPAGAAAGDREDYGPSNTATSTLLTSAPPTKALLTPAPATPEATIGEQIVYQITVPGAANASDLFDVAITDTVDANLEIIGVSVTGVAGAVDTSTATQLDIAFTQIPAGQQAVIELTTRIRNIAGAQQGVDIDNTVSYSYAFTAGGATQPALVSTDLVTINIVEPNIGTIAKSVDIPAPTAGETVRYSVQLSATGGTDNSDVFDVSLIDNLDLGLIYVGNPTVTGAGNTIGAPVVTGDGVTVAQTLVWSPTDGNIDVDITEGTSVTIAYDVMVDNGPLSGGVLSNSAVAEWTGLDGASAFERDGSDGVGGLNDYVIGPASVMLNLPGIVTTIDKIRSNDTFGAGDDDARVGEMVEYTLTVPMPEGTLGNVQIVDTLPQGLDFVGVVSINGDTGPAPYAAVAPFVHADIAAPVEAGDPTAGASTVTWDIGTVTNPFNDGIDDDFVIVYRAMVLDDIYPQVPNDYLLNNTVTLSYDTALATVVSSDVDTVLTVGQPELALTKAANPAGGDSVIDAGEVVEYTLDIENTGTAPAYDTLLEDIIPAGLRGGAPVVTMVSAELLIGGGLPLPAFSYDSATGAVTWDLDTGTADDYTIPAGDTLRLVYEVQAEADLGPGETLVNAATALLYYSFDDDDAPTLGGISGEPEVYGPTTPPATAAVTTAPAAALSKTTADTTVTIGQQMTYRITVPAAPQTTHLEDVRILDDLSSALPNVLSFVSVTRIDTLPWVPVNTGDSTSIVIEDTTTGLDIPPGEQAIVDITVLVENDPANNAGDVFNNTAGYTYTAALLPGVDGTSNDTTIVEADTLALDKRGPSTMQVGVTDTFTIDIENTGSATAYDITIEDELPDLDPANGGMCDTTPTIVSAGIHDNLGVLITPLTGGVDFSTSFSGAPNCLWTLTMESVNAALAPTQRLIIDYDTQIDNDTVGVVNLTNVAAAVEWFSADTAGAGATGNTRTYTGTRSDGTTGDVTDEQDAHTITTEFPVLIFEKRVVNTDTGQDPGTDASPGDTLEYTIYIENVSTVAVPDFSIIDELDALNTTAVFEPNSLVITSALPAGAADNSDPLGGANNTGLIDISNLSLDADGGADTLIIVFEVTLQSSIDNGTVVLNQADLDTFGIVIYSSDDPNIGGASDPTQTLIASAPVLQVEKISTDLSGDPNVLLPGDTLEYTITVKNIGDEDAINASLRDAIPASTTYVANSTTLNGNAVADPTAGESALETGMPINAPENITAGYLRADADPLADNVATVTFRVVVDPTLFTGAVISNQGFVSGDGGGGSAFPQQPSDDPATPAVDDPTLDIVGDLPLIDVQKTVEISADGGTIGVVDTGDELRYTITAYNFGSAPATGVVLTDALPAGTTYVANSTTLNGDPVADPFPLAAGLDISSSDLTLPFPTAGNGVLTPGETAVVVFEVTVVAAAGATVSNQGFVSSNEQATEPTDFDGIDSNGDQPTVVVVGQPQLLEITKDVILVDGNADAGSELEYVVRVTNVGAVDATNVVITDNLDLPVAGQLIYVAGSATMNGLPNGVAFVDPVITADYWTEYGALAPGGIVELRFRAQINPILAIGTTVTNVADVDWSAAFTASASVSVDVGGVIGTLTLNGSVWHDTDYDETLDVGESNLSGWSVELYRNGTLLRTVSTDAAGNFQFTGLAPNSAPGDLPYEIRFVAPGGSAASASLGYGNSAFTDGPQEITDIVGASGANLLNLNLPIQPNGVVYNSVARTPVAGVQLTMINQTRSNQVVPAACFDGVNQQNQVTALGGYYQFDLNFGDPTRCAEGDEYEIQVLPPSGYQGSTSQIIPPVNPVTGAAQDVPNCPGTAADRVPATAQHCENSDSPAQPDTSILPRTVDTEYYLKFLFDTTLETDQIFNNHIPVDPLLVDAIAISKVAGVATATRGQLVPYTITLNNTLGTPLFDLNVVDNFPAGFKYVTDSASVDGIASEPSIDGRQLTWTDIDLAFNQTRTISLLLIVGSGVGEGEYVNTAQAIDTFTSSAASGLASATVRVVPDPTFDCTDVIGKVFDDRNHNGYQDEGERGLAGVEVATARGLRVTTDAYGRFHITCAVIANELRGSSFIMKVDTRTLPSGYRITTENPRVQRATRGKMMKFNFGATIHRVVRLDLANGVFEPGTTQLRPQWKSRIGMLLAELQKAPSILRLSYLAENETEAEVEDRLDAINEIVGDRWAELNCCYKLTIEKEVFWRKGRPADRLRF